MAFVASVHAKAIDLIKLAIDMTTAAGSGHPTSAASLAHLVTVLMYAHMRYDPAEGFPFFPAATGSLGQGLSIANGLALAARLDGLDKRIFCLIGDGESREGQIWEAVDFLMDYHLTAVCPIFNCNGYGQSGKVSAQQAPEVTAAKLRAAGLDVHVIDGHDPAAIQQALQAHAAAATPCAVVARTVKGWGFTSVLGSSVHGRAATEEE